MILNEITEQVKYNCNVSDANYWGYFSMCNLLLKLRELYFHENSMNHASRPEKNEVAEWISVRENLWETLEEKEFEKIKINGTYYDPFDIDLINDYLIPDSMLYGAGYGLLKKPIFFMGEIKSRHSLDNKNIWIIHKEFCRELSPPFAMSQKNNIFIRLDILREYLYNKYLELKTRSEKDSLRLAFEHYGCMYDQDRTSTLDEISKISDEISKILIWHEIGEINERDADGVWLDIVAASDDRLTEFRLRGIKDILADTSEMGTLRKILDHKDRGLLFFYSALLDETRKTLFPEFLESIKIFIENNDWSEIETSIEKGRRNAAALMADIIDIWGRHQEIKEVRKYLMESPLTACRLQK